jgi:type IV pilus assembly protein PilX
MKFRRSSPPAPAARQRGVVLIIALVMLVVVSLLASFSVRNAVSSEAVSGNVRTTQLANQAAEIALRYCEDKTVTYIKAWPAPPAAAIAYPATIAAGPILLAYSPGRAINSTIWDNTATSTTTVISIPATAVNQGAIDTFQRVPECMVENMPVVNAASTGLDTTSTFLVTARGFGPEVQPSANRGRPTGTEVWLQSTIQIQ